MATLKPYVPTLVAGWPGMAIGSSPRATLRSKANSPANTPAPCSVASLYQTIDVQTCHGCKPRTHSSTKIASCWHRFHSSAHFAIPHHQTPKEGYPRRSPDSAPARHPKNTSSAPSLPAPKNSMPACLVCTPARIPVSRARRAPGEAQTGRGEG